MNSVIAGESWALQLAVARWFACGRAMCCMAHDMGSFVMILWAVLGCSVT